MATRGFQGRRRPSEPSRPVPPGQYLERGFPVLTAGPTPDVSLDDWRFALESDGGELAAWSWAEFQSLPQTDITTDIHCVTKWSKQDSQWKGVTVDTLLEAAGVEPPAEFVMAFCHGGYTTNLPLEDLLDGKGMVAHEFEGEPLDPEHGGPARLLVPHLYLWKSAKWIQGLRFMDVDQPGFWEGYGYHMRGDPWQEERYSGD